MTGLHRRYSRRGESGASAVEFVLVMLFVIIPLVMIGIQLVVNTFVRQQATGAARDGAREAIVSYGRADEAGSPDNRRVLDAVNRRLTFVPVNVTVRCTGPDTLSSPPPTIACASALPDRDRVEVAVELRPIVMFAPWLSNNISSKAAQVVVTKG
jgi:Flp pilus assembly pilin Flp